MRGLRLLLGLLLAVVIPTLAMSDTIYRDLIRGDANHKGKFVLSDGSSNWLSIITGSLSADWTLTLPTDDGTNGQVLKTNGSGVSSWTSVSGFGVTTFADTTIPFASATDTFSFDATNFAWDDTSNAQFLMLGGGTAAGQLRLLEGSGGGTNYVAIKAPAALAGNVNLIIPATAVATGGVLYGSAANTTAWLATTARPCMALTNDGASNIPAYSPRETVVFAGIADSPSHNGLTGAETALTLATDEGTPTIAIANLLAGAVLDFDAALTVAGDADGDETLTINVYLGSQLIGTSGAIADDGASTWFIEGHGKIRTAGATGTGYASTLFSNGVVIPITDGVAFTNFDCTATQELIIKADWGGTTDAADTVVLNDANLHINNVD